MGLPGFKPCQILPDKPLGLIVGNLDHYWQLYNNLYLRRESNDCQICSYEYCTEGVACLMFLKHAPVEVEEIDAKWDREYFTWGQGYRTAVIPFVREIVHMRQQRGVPPPIKDWIDQHHGEGVGNQFESLCEVVGHPNNSITRWSFSQIADLIRIHFQMGGDLLEKARALKK